VGTDSGGGGGGDTGNSGGGGSIGTGGPATGGTTRTGGGRGGMAISLERGESSKKRLRIRWDNVIPKGEQALDFKAAVDEIRGGDPRPLIVLRDCDRCNGKDDALLSKTLDNEKVLLLTNWFHCVKLDRRVVEESHPYHALFEGKRPSHLFVTSYDGEEVIQMPGDQSQRVVWEGLNRILAHDYKKDAEDAVGNWRKLLNSFDSLDSQLKDFREQLERLEADEGPSSPKARRLRAKIDRIEKDRAKVLDQEKKVLDLVLKHAPKAKTETDFDAEAAAEVTPSSSSSELLERLRKKAEAKKPGVPTGDGG